MAQGDKNEGGDNPPYMSSFTKQLLGWLNYDSFPLSFGSHWINSLDTSNLHDDIKWYEINENERYILEVRTNDENYTKWDRSAPLDALVLYKVTLKDQEPIAVNIPGYTGPCYLGSCAIVLADAVLKPGIDETYRDWHNLVKFTAKNVRATLEPEKKYEIEAQIEQFNNFERRIKGLVLKTAGKVNYIIRNIESFSFIAPEGKYSLPDLDLHAYTDDGRHVGINYSTGEYEVGIPGAIFSGDLHNDIEWIFIPSDINGVHFIVSSTDTQEFLINYPEVLSVTDGKEMYEVYARIIDPQGVITSDAVIQEIEAGSLLEHPISIEGNNIRVDSGIDADSDHDGAPYLRDNCPNINNTDQLDTDGDGTGDACDNCPDIANPDQADINNNGIGNLCEPDSTPPTIGISGCPQAVNLGASASITVTVTDSESGVAYQSESNGTKLLDTSIVGTKTFTVTARDNRGNEATNNCTYQVIYDFLGAGGFQPPVDDPPITNTAKAGSSVPVKWQLPNGNGGFISDLGAVISIKFQQMACSNFANTLTDPVETTATGNTGLRYDFTSNQYVYNWQTSKIWAGKCYTLNLTLNDGSRYQANFSLK